MLKHASQAARIWVLDIVAVLMNAGCSCLLVTMAVLPQLSRQAQQCGDLGKWLARMHGHMPIFGAVRMANSAVIMAEPFREQAVVGLRATLHCKPSFWAATT